MPSLLHLLGVDFHCSDTKHSTKRNPKTNAIDVEEIMNKDSGGMNWGVIAVYSCPDSCIHSREEFVVIQESVDANPQKVLLQNVESDGEL